MGQFFPPGTGPKRANDIRGALSPEQMPEVGSLKAVSTATVNSGDSDTDDVIESLRAAVTRLNKIARDAKIGR